MPEGGNAIQPHAQRTTLTSTIPPTGRERGRPDVHKFRPQDYGVTRATSMGGHRDARSTQLQPPHCTDNQSPAISSSQSR